MGEAADAASDRGCAVLLELVRRETAPHGLVDRQVDGTVLLDNSVPRACSCRPSSKKRPSRRGARELDIDRLLAWIDADPRDGA